MFPLKNAILYVMIYGVKEARTMRLDLYGILFSPYFLIFSTLCLGMLFGSWKKMGHMKFGVGGGLFIGIVIGYAVYSFALGIGETHAGYKAARSLISNNVIPSTIQNFVLMLFVAATGLLAAKDLKAVLKKYGVKFIVLGVTVTFLGAALSYGSSRLFKKVNVFEASGIYTGALTSSPGLGAALESANHYASDFARNYEALPPGEKEAEYRRLNVAIPGYIKGQEALNDEQVTNLSTVLSGMVGTGYAVSYPFGMIAVVLGIMLLPKLFGISVKKELEDVQKELAEFSGPEDEAGRKTVYFGVAAFAFTCLAGFLLGSVEIRMGPFGTFTLGSIGGVLIAAVLLGYVGNFGPFVFRMDESVLDVIRDLTLGAYIGIIGLSYGYRVINTIGGSGIYFLLISMTVAFLCVFWGFFLGRIVFKMNWIILSGAICGAMTSTPGLGIAVDNTKSNRPVAGYAATYPFALLCMVLFSILMHNIQ
jgi:putative transport protein